MAHWQKNQKTAVSAPLYRGLSHTSRRRSPDFAVRWRPEWPVLYRRRRRSAGRRPPAAGCRTPPVSRSLSRSRCVGPSVVVVSVAVSVARSRCRSRCRSRARSHARGGGLGDVACALSRVMHAMRTLLTYSHVAGRFVVMRARRDEEREDEREERRREDETAAKGAHFNGSGANKCRDKDDARARA